MARGAAGLGVGGFVAGDAGLHGHGQDLRYGFLGPEVAMTFGARNVCSAMFGVTEKDEVGEHVNGPRRHDFGLFRQRCKALDIGLVLRDLRMTHQAGGRWREAGPLARFRGGMAVSAIQLQRGMPFVAERNVRRLGD